jgi:hypothetical protein
MSFVPPPPPGVVVPTPPVATPSATDSTASPASPPAKVVKPGGVALDMSDLFGPPKTGAKKALPPWERKQKTPPPGAPKTASDDPLAPPPAAARTPPTSTTNKSPPLPGKPTQPFSTGVASKLVFKSTAETSYPSLSSFPAPGADVGAASTAGANAPAMVTRKTTPCATLVSSLVRPAPPPVETVLTVPEVTSTPAPQAMGGLPAVVPVPASVGAPPPLPTSNPVTAAALPTYPPTLTAPQQPATSTAAPGIATIAAAPSPATAATQSSPPLLGNDPAARAASVRIVEAALREMRMHLATPSHTVVAPHVVFQGKEQAVAVMPLGPVPPRVKTAKAVVSQATTATPSGFSAHAPRMWHNKYDLQPSPSCPPAYLHGHPTAMSMLGGKSTQRDWRGAYFHKVDVHRYIARRYFGEAPPVEH